MHCSLTSCSNLWDFPSRQLYLHGVATFLLEDHKLIPGRLKPWSWNMIPTPKAKNQIWTKESCEKRKTEALIPSLRWLSTSSVAFIWHKFAPVVTFFNAFIIWSVLSSNPGPVSSNLFTVQPSHSFPHTEHIKPNRFTSRRWVYDNLPKDSDLLKTGNNTWSSTNNLGSCQSVALPYTKSKVVSWEV